MSLCETRHGVYLSIFGIGTLIVGDSGVGKSEVAVELVRRGHKLVADDRVDFKLQENLIVGEAPNILKGYVEIRGIGIVNVNDLFSSESFLNSINLEFIIKLKVSNDKVKYERIGLENKTEKVLGEDISYMVIPVDSGRSIATIVEVAVKKFIQLKHGNNPSEEFIRNIELSRKESL